MGTRLFPLSADQEKAHFVMATEGQLDRFDGDINEEYLTDVKNHMTKVFSGWDRKSTDPTFLQFYSNTLKRDFSQKFPFTINRFGEKCSEDVEADKNQIQVGSGALGPNTRAEGRFSQNRMGGTLVQANAKVATTRDPQTSPEQLRMAQVHNKIVNEGVF